MTLIIMTIWAFAICALIGVAVWRGRRPPMRFAVDPASESARADLVAEIFRNVPSDDGELDIRTERKPGATKGHPKAPTGGEVRVKTASFKYHGKPRMHELVERWSDRSDGGKILVSPGKPAKGKPTRPKTHTAK